MKRVKMKLILYPYFYAFLHFNVSSVFNYVRYKSNISNKYLQISRGTRNRNFLYPRTSFTVDMNYSNYITALKDELGRFINM